MNTRPIPVPPPGTQLEWRLDAPYSARHVLMIIAMLALLLWSGHRTEMDRMLGMSAQAVGKTLGLTDDSQVLRGLCPDGGFYYLLTARCGPALAQDQDGAVGLGHLLKLAHDFLHGGIFPHHRMR